MNLLAGRRSRGWLFAALYFCEGAPIGYLWWTLPVVLRQADWEVDTIGALTAALALPWAFKFLWAPLVDVLRGSRWGFRAWIVASQTAMAVSLLPLLLVDGTPAPGVLFASLLVHAFCAATQDVAIDGLAIRHTPPGERGRVNAFMQGGMLVGRGLFGGGALMLRADWGDRSVIFGLIGVIGCALLLALAWREPEETEGTPRERLPEFGRHLLAAVRSRATWLGLGLAASAGAAFEAVGSKATVLLEDFGAEEDVRSFFFLAPVLVCMAVGAWLGGRAADRRGDIPAAGATIVVTALAVVVLGCALGRIPPDLLVIPLGIVYVGAGALTAAQYALLMDLTDPRLGATQFSAFMGATNLCEAWASLVVGVGIVEVGYGWAFAALASLSLLSLVVLRSFSADRRPSAA